MKPQLCLCLLGIATLFVHGFAPHGLNEVLLLFCLLVAWVLGAHFGEERSK